jgi:hypothetical protein
MFEATRQDSTNMANGFATIFLSRYDRVYFVLEIWADLLGVEHLSPCGEWMLQVGELINHSSNQSTFLSP